MEPKRVELHGGNNGSRDKKIKRREVLEKKKAIDELIKNAASKKDHLAEFQPFRHFNRNGLSVYLESGSGPQLSSSMKQYIQNLLKVNMEGSYGLEWPTEEKVKRREMVAPEAHYMFVREARNANGDEISSREDREMNCTHWIGEGDPVVGFVQYRFVVEEEIPVAYVYELQLEHHVHGKGLGKFLMQLIELIARKNYMGAVMLTVQKANLLAMNFYTSKLRYMISTISPSRVDPMLGVEKSYEILCKTFDQEAKAILEMTTSEKTSSTNNNRQWTNFPEMNKDFIDLCVHEISVSGHQGTSLCENSWKTIKKELSSKYPMVFNDLKDQQQHKFIKNHWMKLKKKYTAWCICKSYTGNVFNEETGFFTFDDDQWDALKKVNADTTQFRYKPLEFKEEMHAMFDGILVSFDGAKSVASANKDIIDMIVDAEGDTEGEAPGFTQDTYFEGVSFTQESRTPTTPFSPTGSGTSKSAAKRKRRESTPASEPSFGDLVGAIQLYMGIRIAQHEKMAVTSDEEKKYSMASCMEIIMDLQQEVPLVEENLMLAIRRLGKSLEYRKSLISLKDSASRAFFLNSLGFK